MSGNQRVSQDVVSGVDRSARFSFCFNRTPEYPITYIPKGLYIVVYNNML